MVDTNDYLEYTLLTDRLQADVLMFLLLNPYQSRPEGFQYHQLIAVHWHQLLIDKTHLA